MWARLAWYLSYMQLNIPISTCMQESGQPLRVWMLVALEAPTFLILLDEGNNININIDGVDVVL